ncbi:MAG: uL22 family ribosomal protein [Elusimicrobiaceae bacterium]|jgi:large subunit ribosomal protein L22
MEAVSKAKFQRYGRRKVGQIADQIRGKSVHVAEQLVEMAPRRASEMVRKAIHAAAANLSVKLGKPLNPDAMWVKTIYSDSGPMKHLKRVQPGPQGRAMPYKRKVCHLTVVVSDSKKEEGK